MQVKVQPYLDDFELTAMQVGLLSESAVAPSTGIHIEQVVCEFAAVSFEVQRVRSVWAMLAQRHAALRSVCHGHLDQKPRICVLPSVEVELAVEIHGDLSGVQRKQMLDDWLLADRSRGVDVGLAPPWRVAWLQWAEGQATMVWTFHHLFLDGTSIEILVREFLMELSGTSSTNGAAEVDAAPGQADYVRALHRWQQDTAATGLARQYFSSAFRDFEMPAEGGFLGCLARSPLGPVEQAAVDACVTDLHADVLSSRLHAQLVCLAQNVNSSLSNILKAAWMLVLSRWTSCPDIVLGEVRSGRFLLPGAGAAVGCLINTVPVRQKLHGDPTLGTLLSQLDHSLQKLRLFEHVPLASILEWSDQSPGTNLLQALYLFEPRPLNVQARKFAGDWCRVDLREKGSPGLFLMAMVDEGIELRLEYARNALSEKGALLLLASLRRALEGFAQASPDTRLSAINTLDQDVIDMLARRAWPADAVDTAEACVASHVEAWAKATPESTAVMDLTSGRSLTYGQLNVEAHRVASLMVSMGVQPGDHIAICLPRSLGFIVSMVAAMKSGASWVPVDPGYPAEVIQYMLTDSRAKLVLADDASLDVPVGVQRFSLHEAYSHPASSDINMTSARRWPVSRPAYLVYTSGSTGKPKGVQVDHHALACHAQATIRRYALSPDDRVLQFASLSFDVSLEEIVPTLVAGATLLLRNESMAQSFSDFLSSVQSQRITLLNLPTAFWQACVEHLQLTDSRVPETVRLLVIGGEKAPRPAFESFRQMHPAIRLINAYGPTEGTITSLVFEPAAGEPLPAGLDVPIGHPMGHARAVVLCADGSLAPPGVHGELCIGGPCLAMGYLGLPQATNDRFVQTEAGVDPWISRWGLNRLYRTGDLAWWDPAGNLRFAGRRDRQVKLRGFRLELPQIEAAVESLDGVARCVSAIDFPGQPHARLFAWVSPLPGRRLEASELSRLMDRILPVHMRPEIRTVAQWPVTPGGKVDVVQLLRSEQNRPADHAMHDPVITDSTVLSMTSQFASVLGRASVSPDDSFFDLGGNSLLAVRLIAAIERQLSVRVSIGQLKSYHTPSSLVSSIRGTAPTTRYLIEIKPNGNRVPVYGIHSLGADERFYRPLAASLHPDQPLFGLTTGYSLLSDESLTLEGLARHYFEDIMAHRPEGPVVLAAVSMCAYVAFELAVQLSAAGREVKYVMLFDAEGPDGKPLVRGAFRRLSVHWQSMSRKGVTRYVSEKMALRLMYAGRWRTRLGLLLARRLHLADARPYDHPDDALFVGQLERMVAAYNPRTYHGDLLVFQAEEDTFVDLRLAKMTGLGWAGVCRGQIRLLQTPGGHMSMLTQPHVSALAQQLNDLLEG
jgi:amino acid adenylation domain-containing protein